MRKSSEEQSFLFRGEKNIYSLRIWGSIYWNFPKTFWLTYYNKQTVVKSGIKNMISICCCCYLKVIIAKYPAFRLRNFIENKNTELKYCGFFICTTLCFWLNLWVDITPSSQDSVPQSSFTLPKKLLTQLWCGLKSYLSCNCPLEREQTSKVCKILRKYCILKNFLFFSQRKCASSVMSVMYRWWELVGTVNVLQ